MRTVRARTLAALTVAAVAVAAGLLAGCGGPSPGPRPSGGVLPTAPARAHASPSSAAPLPRPDAEHPCLGAPAPARWQHVVWIVMENKPYGAVIGSRKAPYENALADACALATDYHGVTHPSLPNYLALVTGDTHGVRDDAGPDSHHVTGPSLFAQVADAGGGWRSYVESMPGDCALSPGGAYAVKHNPAAYLVRLRAACLRWDVPMGGPSGRFATDLARGSLPEFAFVVPNLCDDTHSCSVATGDRWLKAWVSAVLDSPSYAAGTTAVAITWDEDDKSHDNHIPLIVVAPSVRPGTRVGTDTDHRALLRTTEDMLGLPALRSAARAPSLRTALHL